METRLDLIKRYFCRKIKPNHMVTIEELENLFNLKISYILLTYYQLNPWKQISVKFWSNDNQFIEKKENAICKMVSNLLRLEHVKLPCSGHGISLWWPHNERDGVLNYQPHDCLLKRLFRHRSKKTSKLRVTDLCEGNSPHKGPLTRKMFPFDDVIMIQNKLGQHHPW